MVNVKHTPNWWQLASILLIIVLVGLGIYIGKSALTPSSPLPDNLHSQLTFSPLIIPRQTNAITTRNYTLSKTDDNVQLLTFIIDINNTSVTVSEYMQPTQFAEIPEYKDKFLANVIQQQDTAQSSSGAIYIGKMTKQADHQLAVMIEKGLLILMNPEKSLSNEQWRKIGDNLEVLKQ